MSFKAADIAEHILCCNKFYVEFKRKPINHIKLQALLYMVQTQYIKRTGSVCFDDTIYVDKSINAPYIYEVWRIFGKFGDSVIPFNDNYPSEDPKIPYTITELINDTIYATRDYDGADLFNIIRHSEAYEGSKIQENNHILLSIDKLKTFLVNN
jgi:hypothetical protein